MNLLPKNGKAVEEAVTERHVICKQRRKVTALGVFKKVFLLCLH